MNRFVTRKLREFGSTLRKMNSKGAKMSELRKTKESMLSTIYSMLCVCLGNPPDSFDWQTRDKNKKFVRLTGLTPLDFYKKTGVNLKDVDLSETKLENTILKSIEGELEDIPNEYKIIPSSCGTEGRYDIVPK